MKPSQSTPYATEADILANAHISDQADIMRIDQLAPEIQAHLEEGRQSGYHPVSVRWPTGQFALLFCEVGTEYPSANSIIAAYQQCLQTTKTFPDGTQS
jgi:hypothetical protein